LENGITRWPQPRREPRCLGDRRIFISTVVGPVLIGLAALIALLAFARYVVPWILQPPKFRDLAILTGLFVAAVPIAFALDALGASPWIALLLLAVTATAYVLVSERRTHRGGHR